MRRRFQRGTIIVRGSTPRRYGMYREDVLQSDGTFKRVQRTVLLGPVSGLSERAAWKQFQPFLDRVNVATKMPPKSGMSLDSFVKEWRTNVAVNLKGSTTRAAESHLRAHILPKLGSLSLTEINTKTVQTFVAYLATGGRSRKTVENVLLTLSSILRTARAWEYVLVQPEMER
jgi:Phage integrase, N-terminal SAM-like domain